MRYTELIGSQSDYVERHSIKPKYYPCPQCGQQGTRKRVLTRRVRHVAALSRCSWIVAEVGVYQARGDCGQYFQAAIPGVPYRGRYAYEGRNTVANALIRDRMPYGRGLCRMQEEYGLPLSLGYLHECFLWAPEQLDLEAPWECVVAHFSGGLCIDEVHDSGRTILFATDPLNHFTVSFKLVETNDQDHMEACVQSLKDRGLIVEVALTDGSPLYKDSLQSYWKDLEHQLCLFHVIKEVNQLILDGGRAIKNGLKRQGNKGRKQRRGRPSQKAQRHRRQGLPKKEQAAFIWEHQYLSVRKAAELSEQDRDDLALRITMAPELALFRRCNQQFDRLFDSGITKPCARYRRTRMVNTAEDQAHSFLVRALKKVRKDVFEKMSVLLGWANVDRTNNHVERNNRVLRMLPKTRYKRRKVHTIEKALELELYARMVGHPFYAPFLQEVSTPFEEADGWKMAA